MVADKCHVVLSCFWGEKAPRENPPNGNFFVFSHGGRSPRHTKVRHFSCVAFSPHVKTTIWRVFAWRPFPPPGKDTTNRGENAKGRHAKTRQMMTCSCFRIATFRPTTRKYATFYALRFRILFVVYLPGEAKGCHAKTRQNQLLAGFRVATYRVFAPKTRLYDMA